MPERRACCARNAGGGTTTRPSVCLGVQLRPPEVGDRRPKFTVSPIWMSASAAEGSACLLRDVESRTSKRTFKPSRQAELMRGESYAYLHLHNDGRTTE